MGVPLTKAWAWLCGVAVAVGGTGMAVSPGVEVGSGACVGVALGGAGGEAGMVGGTCVLVGFGLGVLVSGLGDGVALASTTTAVLLGSTIGTIGVLTTVFSATAVGCVVGTGVSVGRAGIGR